MERSSLILEKIREISEDETANCESFHLAIYISATKIGLYEISDR